MLLKAKNSYKGRIIITILNLYGTVIDKIEIEKTNELLEVKMDITDFAEGLYSYNIEYGDYEMVKKLMVSRR